MNRCKLLRMTIALAATALLGQAQLSAQTWQTVDNFQYTPGKGAGALGAGLDTQGNLYTVGSAFDAANIQHALVMRSSDQGVTWAAIEDFNYRPGTNTSFYGFGVDPAQNLYAVGLATMGSSRSHWLVRKSADHGVTWATVDDYVPDSGASDQRNTASGFAADSSGNIYVVGMGFTRVGTKSSYPHQYWIVRKSSNSGASWSTVDQYGYPNAPESSASAIIAAPNGLFVCGISVGGPHWVVRKSVDGGASWSTVDDFYSGTLFNQPTGLTADSAGNVYVGGVSSSTSSGSYAHNWVVRKGTNGGTTWQTVDAFRYVPNPTGLFANESTALGCDIPGNVYAVGSGTDANNVSHWLTRKSADQGVSWSTADDFQYVSGKAAIPHCFGLDAAGNVYVGGFGRDPANVTHWLVRKAIH